MQEERRGTSKHDKFREASTEPMDHKASSDSEKPPQPNVTGKTHKAEEEAVKAKAQKFKEEVCNPSLARVESTHWTG